MIFARKMTEFYIIIARKIFFPNFRGGGHMPSLPHLVRLCCSAEHLEHASKAGPAALSLSPFVVTALFNALRSALFHN